MTSIPNDTTATFVAADLSVSSGMRYNAGKLRYDLLPPDALEELVKVFSMGAQKYAPRNWERGFDWMSCYASMLRHAQRWAMGEDRDEESGLLHMAHVTWNAMALTTFMLRGAGTDDRPKIELLLNTTVQ